MRGDRGRQLTTLFLGLVAPQFSAAGLAVARSRVLWPSSADEDRLQLVAVGEGGDPDRPRPDPSLADLAPPPPCSSRPRPSRTA